MIKKASLWSEAFEIPNSAEQNKKLLKKVREPKEPKIAVEKRIRSKKVSTEEKIQLITDKVHQILGKQVDNVVVIKTKDELRDYITDAINNGAISIDTETDNSLDPITAKLMGLCLYTPNKKQAYVPVNHINYKTRERLPWQLTEQEIKQELKRVVNSQVLTVMHNAKFDYQILKKTCGIEVPYYWDTIIAAKLINENELADLKTQYILHIDPDQEKYSIEELFEKQEYAIFPPEVFAIYAATDPYMTYELYMWQKEILESPEYSKVNYVFRNVEMPCIRVVAEMELAGVELDMDYAQRLSVKYNKKLEEIDSKIDEELNKYSQKIDTWRLTKEANFKPKKETKKLDKYGNKIIKYGKSKSEQLQDPINLGSPTQLAILLYDILEVESVSKKFPRGTGEDILKLIDLPLCKLMVERREILKLINAFIDSLPKQVNPVDGRIHAVFKQYGAATGRFSSKDPNLQQIPSHNKEIRLMFKAKDGYTFVGSDFSQQEPRLLALMTQDDNMIRAYKEGKDLYATIASGIYNNKYEDNQEHFPDGSPNPEGKKRRSSVKSILLGIMYGRGAGAIAEQIGGTFKEAQDIIDSFYTAFPKVKNWMDETVKLAKLTGYVEDFWGRRRRLPDILLPEYEIIDKSNKNSLFNPFIGCVNKQVENKKTKYYYAQLATAKTRRDVERLISSAAKEELEIKNNSGLISKAERQCVNARIQGGAATMTKIAMSKLFRDKELNDLGFKLLLGVHDELIGECPEANADAVAERMTYIMKTCIDDVSNVPFKCDADICDHWYYNDYVDVITQEYNTLIEEGNTAQDALNLMIQEHTETLPEELIKILA